MAYDLTFLNGSSLDEAYVGLASQNTSLFPLLLLFEYLVILLTGTFTNKRNVGYSNIMLWSTIASFTTFISALFLSFISGLIDLVSLSIIMIVFIASAAGYIMSDTE